MSVRCAVGRSRRGCWRRGPPSQDFFLYKCVVIVEEVVLFHNSVEPGEEFESDVWVGPVVQCDVF